MKARKCYRRALELDPLQAAAGAALCDLLHDSNSEALVRGVCEEILEACPAAEWARRRLGQHYLWLERPRDAIRELQVRPRLRTRRCACAAATLALPLRLCCGLCLCCGRACAAAALELQARLCFKFQCGRIFCELARAASVCVLLACVRSVRDCSAAAALVLAPQPCQGDLRRVPGVAVSRRILCWRADAAGGGKRVPVRSA